MTASLEFTERNGKKVDCPCRECQRDTKHEILAGATLSGSSGPAAFSYGWQIEHQILQCLGCETIRFRRVSGSEHDFVQIGPDDWEYQPLIEVYPNPRGRQALGDAGLLSEEIRRIYGETLQALNESQPVLCGIGIRAIIETVCKDKSAQGGTLNDKIDSLVASGVLTKDGAQVLHRLRVLGNSAAHEVKPHSLRELGLAFDVVDHLLLGVYILPEHAKTTFK
ncbi:MAG: DUF4145 domain-containing protein [Thiocapsa sp.]|uniref:DUF4145 domain-containing protein n=1 Tax=Thiocapsa sp. TaxID=2024551 RepID=UPI001BCAB3EF|nr:DUF4145 domain-containing protein [Thiocapsa sp.]QVL49073.1 MAG: DUF4145 domain-containing protein [Thiocapsa sp.]